MPAPRSPNSAGWFRNFTRGNEIPVPEEQVAGHSEISVTDDQALEKRTYAKEAEFYRQLVEDVALQPYVPELHWMEQRDREAHTVRQRLRRFYRRHHRSHRDKNYVVAIENLTQGFNHASVLDVKLGNRLHEQDADALKKVRMKYIAKHTTSRNLGVAVMGLRAFDPNHLEFDKYNKSFGKRLTPRNITDTFRRFFPDTIPVTYQAYVLRGYLQRLTELTAIVKTREFRIVGSSLLFVYEGDLTVWEIWDAQNGGHVEETETEAPEGTLGTPTATKGTGETTSLKNSTKTTVPRGDADGLDHPPRPDSADNLDPLAPADAAAPEPLPIKLTQDDGADAKKSSLTDSDLFDVRLIDFAHAK
ncbi:hypothetical protein IWQ60_000316 [Tieghemiomyces parasiticus]|uniref:Kinase n=1 Tax=Tieghemiomyces parasiticus TaxID=78921 RepID=A0A9W8AG65_9FUNG|nr:hypothetical protein IWQ60_000316 [Tieghemiomyces parasiticus]